MNIQILIFSTLFVGVFSFGQTSLNASAASVSNASGSVSYSIGQVAYQNVSNTFGSVSQGVQQPYAISALNLEEKAYNFSLSAFPNPTTDVLNLRVGNYKQESMNYSLLDATGKLISEGKITQQETVLDTKMLPTATYFVEVHHEGKKVQTFKVIKNQ
jgi:hypothetical protein